MNTQWSRKGSHLEFQSHLQYTHTYKHTLQNAKICKNRYTVSLMSLETNRHKKQMSVFELDPPPDQFRYIQIVVFFVIVAILIVIEEEKRYLVITRFKSAACLNSDSINV